MTLPMRCPSSLVSILTVAAHGNASPASVIEAACWGDGALGQCADTRVADRMVPASLALICSARFVLLHVLA
jgi:hypothetical protein